MSRPSGRGAHGSEHNCHRISSGFRSTVRLEPSDLAERSYIAAVFVTDLVSGTVVAAVLAAFVVARSVAKRAFERRVSGRLPVGHDGIIPGAGPIDLPASEPTAPAALLVHGFGDTPQSLGYLARALHERGWSVRVPLLPGHGRSIRDWGRTGADDWFSYARRERDDLLRTHDTVALVGLSMGGALATLLATDRTPDGDPAGHGSHGNGHESAIACLVLLAPYFALPLWMRLLTTYHWAIATVLPYVSARGDPSIVDPVERVRSLAYGATTPRLVHELGRVARRAWTALPQVTVPTLVVQSHNDKRTTPTVAAAAVARLEVVDKRLVWIDDGGHVLTVDHGRDAVATAVGEWLDAHAPSRAQARKVRPA
jgi:carboxylesterase